MSRVLFDTCILIDLLRGIPAALDVVSGHDDPAISVITWIEVMAGAPDGDHGRLLDFLAGFDLVGIDRSVMEVAAQIRRQSRSKLPDAVIFAAARVSGRILITRDRRGFPADDPGVVIPYEV